MHPLRQCDAHFLNMYAGLTAVVFSVSVLARPLLQASNSSSISSNATNTSAASALAVALSSAARSIPLGTNNNETFNNVGAFEDQLASDPNTLLGIYGNYENGLYTGVCAPVTVIYARGTAESGNVGYLAGPPFFDTLRALIGTNNVAVQGVDYAADTAGFLEGGDIPGSELMLVTSLGRKTMDSLSQGYTYISCFDCLSEYKAVHLWLFTRWSSRS